MKQCIDIFTGIYTDNIDKKHKGAGFAAICVGKVGTQTFSESDPNLTYLQIWMREVASIIEDIPTSGHMAYEELTLFIHTWTPNINKMCKKMESIFNQLKDLDENAWDVVELKLRRANRSKYEYHDDMVSIVNTLLKINRRIRFNFKFCVTPPKKVPHMGTAFHKAELALTR